MRATDSQISACIGAKRRAARLPAMRLFAGLIPHSRLSGRTLAAAATNSTGFVAVGAVSQTVKGSMKNISCNNYEQLEGQPPQSRLCPVEVHSRASGTNPGRPFDVVGRRQVWSLSKTGEARAAHDRLEGRGHPHSHRDGGIEPWRGGSTTAASNSITATRSAS